MRIDGPAPLRFRAVLPLLPATLRVGSPQVAHERHNDDENPTDRGGRAGGGAWAVREQMRPRRGPIVSSGVTTPSTRSDQVQVKTIVLVSCASKKLNHRARAQDLYVSELFRKSLAYARTLRPAAVFILSAKHGLVRPDEQIDPYDVTLNKMSLAEVRAWSDGVFGQLQQHTDADYDRFVFLAGDRYRRSLVPRLRSVDVPMEGLNRPGTPGGGMH